MSTYIHLLEYTQKGIENINESPDRLDDAKQAAKSFGGEIKDFYLTFGEFDIVLITKFPDDESAAQWILNETKKGAVSSETLKAFTEEEYRDVITGLTD